MKQENVETLYAKLGKSVPKSKKRRLKTALENADDSKFVALHNFEAANKSPVKGINGLVCFFATLLGAIFLVCNLIAFLYITPKFNSYANYAAKLGDGLSAQYYQLSDYGTTNSASKDNLALLKLNEDYNVIVTNYNAVFAELQEKETAYNEKFTAYSDNLTFTGNKSENFLSFKIQLAELEEPEVGAENYEDLKEKYDETKSALEEEIADYENRVENLQADYAAVEEARAQYDVAAAACADVTRQIIEWQKVFHQTEAYKASVYNIYLGGSDGIISYMNNCNKQLEEQLAAYISALATYEKIIADISALPEVIQADEDKITKIEELYTSALNDLKAYAATVAEYRGKYNKFISDNAHDLTKNNKLVADLGGVLKTDEEDTEEVQAQKIVTAAKELLENYKVGMDAFAEEEKTETNAGYILIKEIYDLLNDAIDGKEDGEIPQAFESLFGQSAEWVAQYNAKIEEYTNELSDYNKVLNPLNLTNYSNYLIERNGITNQIGDLTAQIETETDSEKKAALQSSLETLNINLAACNTNIAQEEAKVAVYQKISDDSATWTVDYFVDYCVNNKEDKDFALHKTAFEAIQNAASSVGNSEKITLAADKFKLSETVLNKEQAENQALDSYYSAEELALRLQTALNAAYDLSEDLREYYGEINTIEKLDWLNVNEDMRKTVHGKLAYKAHTDILNAYLSGTEKIDITTLFFDKFEITDDGQPRNAQKLIEAADFINKIERYTALANDVNGFKESANKAVIDYIFVPKLAGTLIMVYDIIMIVLYAAYFAHHIYDVNATAKEENYEKILNTIAE